MADSRDTQGPALVGFGEPLKQIANLYGTTASASTPYTKDSDQKQIPPRYMAEITQAVLERLKETIPAQTPTSAPNTVLETPGSATISPESTDQIHEPSLVMGPATASSSTDRETEIKNRSRPNVSKR